MVALGLLHWFQAHHMERMTSQDRRGQAIKKKAVTWQVAKVVSKKRNFLSLFI